MTSTGDGRAKPGATADRAAPNLSKQIRPQMNADERRYIVSLQRSLAKRWIGAGSLRKLIASRDIVVNRNPP